MSSALLEAAREIDPDLVVLGDAERPGWMARLFDGPVRPGPLAPALLVRGTRAGLPRRILVAISDPQQESDVLRQARRFGLRFDADVTVLHVITGGLAGVLGLAASERERTHALARLQAYATQQVEKHVAWLRDAGLRADALVVTGDIASAILSAARSLRADLIIVGARRQNAIARRLMGVVADDVLRRAESSVVIAPMLS